jgi:RNA polymerase sigma-70 factor (ECF subfamily)
LPEVKVRPMELPSSGPDPEGAVASVQVKQLFQTEMRRMPPLLRNVMVLRDVQQLPMAEAAAQLGITVQAAKSRLMRARMEMRSRLTRKHNWIRSSSAPLSTVAAPLERVGRRCAAAARS